MSETSGDTTENTLQPVPAPIRFVAQYVRDLSFEAPQAPAIFTEIRKRAPDIPVSFDCDVRHLQDSAFEVSIRINCQATVGDMPAFVLEVDYGCVVEINESMIPKEQLHPALLIEIPRYIFPAMRQIVADMTSGGGFPPLFLQPIDFGVIYQRKYGNTPQTIQRNTASA